MSAPAEQLHLPFYPQPEAAHALRISTHFAHDSYASTPISANIDLRLGMLPVDFDPQEFDVPHYFQIKDGKRIPVTDTFSIIESYVDGIHSFRGVNSLPHTSELEVQGRVLTEGTRDRRFHHVATSILSLTPANQQKSQMSTELVLIGDEPVNRLGRILEERLDGNRYHKPAIVAFRGLAYMRQYAKDPQRKQR